MRSAFYQAVAAATLFGSTVAAQLGPPFPVATLPLNVIGAGTLIVRLRVNDSEPLDFILDSGAGACVVDQGRASTLGLRLGARGTGTGAGAGTYRVDSIETPLTFRADALSFACDGVYAIDLSGLPAILGRRIDGIIGYGLFAQFVAEISYDTRLLRLFEPRAFRYSGSGDTIEIDMRMGVPYVRTTISVEGQPPTDRWLLVDTGSEDAVDDSLVLASTGPKRRVRAGVGLGREYEAVFGRLKRVVLGRTELRDVPSVAPGVGLIGAKVLSRFRLTLDYPGKRAFLEADPRYFGAFDPGGWSGLVLRVANGGFRVHEVYEGFAASRAGLRRDDVIAAIDGTPADRFEISQLSGYLARQGIAARLAVLRGGKTISLEFTDVGS